MQGCQMHGCLIIFQQSMIKMTFISPTMTCFHDTLCELHLGHLGCVNSKTFKNDFHTTNPNNCQQASMHLHQQMLLKPNFMRWLCTTFVSKKRKWNLQKRQANVKKRSNLLTTKGAWDQSFSIFLVLGMFLLMCLSLRNGVHWHIQRGWTLFIWWSQKLTWWPSPFMCDSLQRSMHLGEWPNEVV